MENKKHYLFEIKAVSDGVGSLAVLEAEKNLPFKIKRVFYEYNVSNKFLRGLHANKNSRFCLISVSGSCEVMVDDGAHKTLYNLDQPTKVLYLDKMVWKSMKNFSKDCVLLVLSDCYYDKNEYVRDHEEFVRLVKNGK